jgi:hypothetical protein
LSLRLYSWNVQLWLKINFNWKWLLCGLLLLGIRNAIYFNFRMNNMSRNKPLNPSLWMSTAFKLNIKYTNVTVCRNCNQLFLLFIGVTVWQSDVERWAMVNTMLFFAGSCYYNKMCIIKNRHREITFVRNVGHNSGHIYRNTTLRLYYASIWVGVILHVYDRLVFCCFFFVR